MAGEAVLCPSCGTRNRPDWEFCARCEESLEGALPADAADAADDATAKVKALKVELRPFEISSLTGSSVLVVAVLAFGVLGFAAYRHVTTTPPPEGPDPQLFTIATRPVELPKVPPSGEAGVSDFDAGRRLLGSGDLQEAISLLAAAVAANPDNAAFRGHLAYALWQVGNTDQALAEHAEAARLDPHRQVQYARALAMIGRPDEAELQYEAILARTPEGAGAMVHEDLGRLLFRAGRYVEAAPHLDQAVDARDDDPVLKQELAYALDQEGSGERAETLYRDVLETAPQAVLTRSLLAENLFERGQKEGAMSLLEEGLALTPEAPLLQRQLGSLLERDGKRAEAADAYRAYATLAPNAPDAATIKARAERLGPAGATR